MLLKLNQFKIVLFIKIIIESIKIYNPIILILNEVICIKLIQKKEN